MAIPFKFDLNKPVSGEASIGLDLPRKEVFEFVGERFFENYPKWAEEVAEFQPLDGYQVYVGARARQVRKDNGVHVESVFEITELSPTFKLAFQGISAPYKQSYLLEECEARQSTRLTFRFELLELEIFMRPFEKLIRFAIEEGVENTVANIKKLVGTENV